MGKLFIVGIEGERSRDTENGRRGAFFKRSVLEGIRLYVRSPEEALGAYRAAKSRHIFNSALQTMMEMMPPRLFGGEKIAARDFLSEGDYLCRKNVSAQRHKIKLLEDMENGLRLTNTCWEGGAVAIFYPGIMRKIGRLLGQDYYFTFPSADEVRIHPVKYFDAEEVFRAISDYNSCEYRDAPMEKISDRVYIYNAARNEARAAELRRGI